MRDIELTDGSPVPTDHSHTELKENGQQKGYVVLSPEERAKGFKKPLRHSYVHNTCGSVTSMGRALSETYARDPRFYSGTFCCACSRHFNLSEFKWLDGEPMDPTLQDAWHIEQVRLRIERNAAIAAEVEQSERAELARLKAKYE